MLHNYIADGDRTRIPWWLNQLAHSDNQPVNINNISKLTSKQ